MVLKGERLSIWLSLLGAKVYGISLKNKNKNNHYNIVKSKLALKEIYIDIRDKKKIINIFKKINPDFVFHLAAQSLVYNSIKKPSLNWETNVIGFLNILIILKKLKKKCTAILITSDKCYKNYEKKKVIMKQMSWEVKILIALQRHLLKSCSILLKPILKIKIIIYE